MLVNVHTKVPDHRRRLEDAVTDGQGEICLAQLGELSSRAKPGDFRFAPPQNIQHTVDHCWFSYLNIFRLRRLTKPSVVGEAMERYAVSVSDLLQLGRIRQIQKRSESGALRNTGV